ncbi:DNA-binding transcriptional regulator, LysR family [Alteromonadaceae bacterium Bs31]|nr:DNA-binding transcriptional regulator, LysR family [Alteromonadaceae bacterium Bs31]
MDKFTAMNAFANVASKGSFAAAARDMGLSRSQVNRLVIQLEDHLSSTLLNRTTRKVSLTPIGQAYLQRVKAILNDVEDTERLVLSENEKPTGEIKINAPMSFGTLYLGKAIVAFMEAYPNIRVQLVLSDELIDPVANGFDMTVRIGEPSDSLSLIEHTILAMPRILCASPQFAQQHPTNSIQDLKKTPCLHYGNLPAGNRWKLLGPEGGVNVQVKGVLCSNNGEILCEAALKHLGVALLPTFIAGRELQCGRLVRILPQYQASPLSLNLLYPPNRHLSERIRVLVKFMQAQFSQLPPWGLLS